MQNDKTSLKTMRKSATLLQILREITSFENLDVKSQNMMKIATWRSSFRDYRLLVIEECMVGERAVRSERTGGTWILSW